MKIAFLSFVGFISMMFITIGVPNNEIHRVIAFIIFAVVSLVSLTNDNIPDEDKKEFKHIVIGVSVFLESIYTLYMWISGYF